MTVTHTNLGVRSRQFDLAAAQVFLLRYCILRVPDPLHCRRLQLQEELPFDNY